MNIKKNNEQPLRLAFPIINLDWVKDENEVKRLAVLCRKLGCDIIQMGMDQGAGDDPFPDKNKIRELKKQFAGINLLLKKEGIITVLDLATLLHGYERVHHKYHCMRGLSGRKLVSPCTLDKRWRLDIASLFASFADAGFEWLWPDDDFRLDNHGEFHACYCARHIAEFNRRTGYNYTRLTLLKLMNKVFPLTQDEKIQKHDWFNFKRADMEELASEISAAIHKVNPDCGFGGTLSDLRFASLGGIRVKSLLTAMAGKGNIIRARCGCGGYDDHDRTGKLHSLFLAQAERTLLPADSWAFSEHSCWPANRFTRSSHDFLFQMVQTVSCGFKYQLLFPNLREDVVYQDDINSALPFLHRLSALISADARPAGPVFVFSEKCSFFKGASESFTDGGYNAYEFLSRLGIPLRLAEADALDTETGPFIVTGNTALAVQDKLGSLMKKGLLLDGEAVEILEANGLLGKLGASLGTPVTDARYEYYMDNSLNGDMPPQKTGYPLFIYQDLHREPLPDIKTSGRGWTVLSEFQNIQRGSAASDMQTRECGGGRQALAAIHFAKGRNFLNPYRKRQFGNLLEWLGRRPLSVWLPDTVDVQPVVIAEKDYSVVTLFNFSRDELRAPEIFVRNEKSVSVSEIRLSSGRIQSVEGCRQKRLGGGRISVKMPPEFQIPGGGWRTLVFADR